MLTNECAPSFVAAPIIPESFSIWGNPLGADCRVCATVTGLDAVELNYFYLMGRMDQATGNGYAVRYFYLFGVASWFSIGRMTGWVYGAVTPPINQAVALGDQFAMSVRKNRVVLYYKPVAGLWTVLGEIIDGTYTDGDYIGAGMGHGAVGPISSRLDNFGGAPYLETVSSVGGESQAASPILGDAKRKSHETPGTDAFTLEGASRRRPTPERRRDFRQPMELDYYISPDGVSYQFDTGNGKLLMSFTGDGMPPIEYIRQKGPFQHGETLLDYRLAARVIQYVHRRKGCSRYEYWDNRADLINWLRPNRQAPGQFDLGKLRKILPDGSKRDIDVMIQQGPAFAPRQSDVWDEWAFTESLQFIASDPTFYDPDADEVIWSISILLGKIYYSASALTDLAYPYFYGADIISGSATVTYLGTWLSYPTFELTGPLNQPFVENVTTGEHIQLAYDIAAGETVTISLPYGNKTVTNNFGANLIGTVTSDSDLATFHLAPDPEAAGGVNLFNASGGGGLAGVTQIRMWWYVRYIGI